MQTGGKNYYRIYNILAIIESEEAFIKAVNRKPERLSLPYFFGILKNIQKKQDDELYEEYCRKRYNYQLMLENERRLQTTEEKPPTIEQVLNMLEKGIFGSSRTIRRVCQNLACKWIKELTDSRRYLEPLKKKFMDAIGKLKNLGMEQKDLMIGQIEQLINLKSGKDCVA